MAYRSGEARKRIVATALDVSVGDLTRQFVLSGCPGTHQFQKPQGGVREWGIVRSASIYPAVSLTLWMRTGRRYDIAAAPTYIDLWRYLANRVPYVAARRHPKEEVGAACGLARHAISDSAVLLLELREPLHGLWAIQIKDPDPRRATCGYRVT